MSRTPSIAIVGAGLGGLTLARVLQHTSNGAVDVTVYERDCVSRDQGGSLDIHRDSGQKALKAAGLHEKFSKLYHAEGDSMQLFDKDGSKVFDEHDFQPPAWATGPPGLEGEGLGGAPDRPEIDRGILRELILDAVEPDTLKFGHALTSITPRADGAGYELVFSTPSGDLRVTPDLVVGADGTFSRVRAVVSDAKPDYAGVSFVEMRIDDVDTSHPQLSALVGPGTASALGENQALMAQRNSGGRIRVYAALRIPQAYLDSVNWADAKVAKAVLLGRFGHWAPSLLQMIHASNEFIPRRLYWLPVGHKWEHKAGVTIIGDAAHVMSPFAGEGANLAMLDAAELAQAIVGAGADLDKAVADFEKTMCVRAGRSAAESARNLELFIHPDAPTPAAELMKRMFTEGPPPDHEH